MKYNNCGADMKLAIHKLDGWGGRLIVLGT